MKIVHLADTHLGHSAYRKLSENGFNQREEDVIRAFTDAIDKIILEKPDLVLHSGDLFDTVRPTNRIVSIGIRELLRLYQKDIPLILISGNHETPKQLYKGSIYSIFELMPLDKKANNSGNKLFNIVYKDKCEVFRFPGVTIHAVPQCSTDAIFKAELNNIKLDPGSKNVLMLHAGVTGMKEFSHGESNELLVEYDWLNKSMFDYVALGHYHGYVPVAKNTYFSGSIERMSFNEVGQPKGFLVVDLDKSPVPEMKEVWTRKMIDMSPIDASGKDSVVLLEEILDKISKAEPSGKILRLTITNIPQHVMNTLDTKRIREAAKDAVHFEPRYEKMNEEGRMEEVRIATGGIKEEFKSFLSAKDLSKLDKDKFTELWSNSYDEVIKEEE